MTAPNNTSKFGDRCFGILLRLLPEEFRDRFSSEMRSVFRDQRQDAAHGGLFARTRFWWDTFTGLLLTAVREHREILLQDGTYALRMMRKDLGFTCVAILILGLAIGAATAAFSAANAILIQPLPFADGNRLVQLKQTQPAVGIDNLGFSVKEIEDYRSRNHTLDSVVEYHQMMFSLLGGREPVRVETAVVSANFFRSLGVTPLYGRNFMDEDDRPSAHPVLILSYEFWQRSFAGDPDVVGKTYSMNDKQHVVVGVLPPMPQFPGVVDVYMPTAACPTRTSERFLNVRTARMMSLFAILKPGVSVHQAQDDLRGIAGQLRAAYPDAYPASKGYDISVSPVHEQLTSEIRPILVALGAAATLLLMLACSNVAGLMLSRLLLRSKELTVRAALGASRARITRSFITEGILLSGAGGAVGLLLAYWSLNYLVPFTSQFTTLASQLHMGPAAIGVGIALSIVCGAVVGFVPAIGIRHTPLFTSQVENINPALRMRSRTRVMLVAGQLALSVILLVGAGLTLRTLIQLEHVDGGFRPSGVITAHIYLLKQDFRGFYDALLERTKRVDGVQSAALGSTFPLATHAYDSEFGLDVNDVDHSSRPKPETVSGRAVTVGYFQTIGMRLLAGRDFTNQDTEQSPLVTIVNEHFAKRYWPSGNPIGKTISFGPNERATIIGVVGDVRQKGLDKEPVDEAYCAFAQTHSPAMSLILRSTRPVHELAPEISWIVHDLDPQAVITDIATLSQVREDSLAPRRHIAVFFSIFAALALVITASGISGLMSLEVTERKHEIGIRMALGATPGRVMSSMMARALLTIAVGLGCGFAISWLMSTMMSTLIYGVVPRDSVTFAISALLLVAIAAASSFLPLTRIPNLDPTVLLRAE